MGGETKNGVALFVPKLAFIVDSLTLRTYRISLTALILFSCPPASNRCKVNKNRTPRYVKTILKNVRVPRLIFTQVKESK